MPFIPPISDPIEGSYLDDSSSGVNDPTITAPAAGQRASWNPNGGSSDLQVYAPYMDKGNAYHPGMTSETLFEKDMPLPEDQSNQPRPVSQTLADRVRTNGAYRDIPSYMADVRTEAYKLAQQQGIDIRSPEGAQWIDATIGEAEKAFPHFVSPPLDKKQMIIAKPGEYVFDPSSGKWSSPEDQMAGNNPPLQAPNYPPPSQTPLPNPNEDPRDTLAKNAKDQLDRLVKAGRLNDPRIKDYQKILDDADKRKEGDTNVKLDDLDTNQKAIAKSILNNTFNMPSGMALKTPYWQRIIGAVTNEKPDFDAGKYDNRKKTIEDFSKGKAAQNITALNTAISHIASLKEAGDKLKNTSYPLLNGALNSVAENNGDKRMVGFRLKAHAVAEELSRVFKGQGISDSEIKAWEHNLNQNMSPDQIDESINGALDLMGGRLNAMNDQYKNGVGEEKDRKFLSDQSRAHLKLLGRDPDLLDPVGEGSSSSNPAPKYNFIVGKQYKDKSGAIHVWNGSKMVAQ